MYSYKEESLFFWCGGQSKLNEHLLEAMRKDPGNGKESFYFSQKDPKLIAPKFYSNMGLIFNFV